MEEKKLLQIGDWVTGIGHYTNKPTSVTRIKRVTAKSAYTQEKGGIAYVREVSHDGTVKARGRGSLSMSDTYRLTQPGDRESIMTQREENKRKKWYRSFVPTSEQLKEMYDKYGAGESNQ